jgi:hypothetical protein
MIVFTDLFAVRVPFGDIRMLLFISGVAVMRCRYVINFSGG